MGRNGGTDKWSNLPEVTQVITGAVNLKPRVWGALTGSMPCCSLPCSPLGTFVPFLKKLTVLPPLSIDQGLANFFCQGPESKYFWFGGQLVSVTTTLPMWCEINHRQYGNERVWLCFNKTWFVFTVIWISYNFHLLFFYFILNYLKNVKAFPKSLAEQKQVGSEIWFSAEAHRSLQKTSPSVAVPSFPSLTLDGWRVPMNHKTVLHLPLTEAPMHTGQGHTQSSVDQQGEHSTQFNKLIKWPKMHFSLYIMTNWGGKKTGNGREKAGYKIHSGRNTESS